MTLGVSGDFFHEEEGIGHRDQANPKGGITWNPSFSPGTTFRAAGFRALKRTLVNQQTLEPTQVAGFNQFYDDPSGTSSWRYGAAIDQKFGSSRLRGRRGLLARSPGPEPDRRGLGHRGGARARAREARAHLPVHHAPRLDCAARGIPVRAVPARRPARRPVRVQRGRHPPRSARRPAVPSVGREPRVRRHLSGPGWRVPAQHDAHLRRRPPRLLDVRRGHPVPPAEALRLRGIRREQLPDEDSPYQATDLHNPDLRPGRLFYGKITLAFP